MTAFVTPQLPLKGQGRGESNSLNIASSPRRSRSSTCPRASATPSNRVTILDYGAGNVRSLENAVRLFGYDIHWAQNADDITNAEKLIFPGVGSFGAAMENLHSKQFVEPLKQYVKDNRPFLGICLGLQTLFSASEESPDIEGLGLFPGVVRRFDVQHLGLSVPSIGWNTVQLRRPSILFSRDGDASVSQDDHVRDDRFYFVHSYRLGSDVTDMISESALGISTHGEPYLSILQHGQVCATQFHPEKSGAAGLRLIRNFLSSNDISAAVPNSSSDGLERADTADASRRAGLAKRVVACLDVRENDAGDLVVTKGDQYDVRESDTRAVRNLGKPVSLAQRYFRDGADEICFLNITSFRGEPVGSAPMLTVLRETSRRVFVPLCIGGGIRDYTDTNGQFYSALDVADMYFRAGADKVSIGSDAVYAAEKFHQDGGKADGSSSIERISHVYGAQAVVVSVDPKRVYVDEGEETRFSMVKLADGRRCWYQCTVKGGREGRNIDVVELAKAVDVLGAGEILLNSMDRDGQNDGFDTELMKLVKRAVSIPVIASSGAGKVEHFTTCFDETDVEAGLAAGIFHRQEVSIEEVKMHMLQHGTPVRMAGRVDELVGVDVVEADGVIDVRV